MSFVLGINAYHGDSSACLIQDGEVVAAAEEERFRRIKHWAGFPSEAIKYCLSEADVEPEKIEHIAISRNPMAHLHKKVAFALTRRPSLKLISGRLANMARMGDLKGLIASAIGVDSSKLGAKVHRVEHHLAHSASAFLVSPYEESAVVSIDAFGDFRSTMVSLGEGSSMKPISTVEFPHSMGILYTAVTQYLGFPRYGDEYKVMALASFGAPTYLDEFRKMVRPEPKGMFKLDLDYFRHASKGVAMTWDGGEPEIDRVYSDYMAERLGPAREPSEELTKRHEDLAASLQAALEEVYFHVLNYAHEATGKRALALAGGVAFNSVANGQVFERTPFEDVYIQAAAGDAGTALGAAYHVYHQTTGSPRRFVMNTAYWGPGFDEREVLEVMKSKGLEFKRLPDDELYKRTAEAVAAGKIVGLVPGPRRVGTAGVGQPEHNRGPPAQTDERHPELPHQASRAFQAFCTVNLDRGSR